ncbi:MAG: CofH family radical SAM protein [Saprospiraceae bacterium]|jgi:cyclic dehypoxanthinyl futalosine synthase|uniref:CofH family radical SAM protein n=1 Tax=Candidatus Brachybacter algidus TaxID=2982024 RepID=UPI001B49506A|nr:CofH family radical SAM protein [Candidatus Brachybacter algidus]MBP7307217.1 CofH family radical SAM protein [Saprospiraceae bacterium]HQV89833.1 CofH family radical SAM protein [Nitrosomonas sp.]MBK6373692.1 CofH family radical SAM protein [Candidatus Brachybacter algidus]MBK6450846.1 CofH family radical SAM protein [Candidatus Brachybacter algidus]MBK7604955.1 CofH family radical SAM protein [Candidatus Brachybacter algidus]
MDIQNLLDRALRLEWLTPEEGVFLFENASTADLIYTGNALRQHHVPGNIVTWIIDRNSNTTNVCLANCKFCNFYRIPGHGEAYTTTIEEYKVKIDELFEYGGEQLLLQGGHHPDLGLSFYVNLFKELKSLYPTLKLHALGPPEIAHITKLEKSTHIEVLAALKEAGLDSLPGAGAEILSDRVRRLISKGKCGGKEWLDVMRAAHQLHLTTSATMMFGHVETNLERMEHYAELRQVQSEKPADANGFLAFIPWPFQDEATMLKKLKRARNTCTGDEYIRMIAMSRIMLPNVKNIQASWLTVGKKVGQLSLHAGANDFGSIMIEENVVSAAGAAFRFTANGIQEAIRDAGYTPQLRNQQYGFRDLPANMKQQELNKLEMIVD